MGAAEHDALCLHAGGGGDALPGGVGDLSYTGEQVQGEHQNGVRSLPECHAGGIQCFQKAFGYPLSLIAIAAQRNRIGGGDIGFGIADTEGSREGSGFRYSCLGIGLTGTSVNPARSFGPALFVGGEALSNVWVFLLAPLVGGALAALVYKFLDGKKQE